MGVTVGRDGLKSARHMVENESKGAECSGTGGWAHPRGHVDPFSPRSSSHTLKWGTLVLLTNPPLTQLLDGRQNCEPVATALNHYICCNV